MISALIRRFHGAKVANVPYVTVWGSGTRRGSSFMSMMVAADLNEAKRWALLKSHGYQINRSRIITNGTAAA